MTIPTTRPSALSRGSLLAALLITAAVVLISALGAANAHGATPSASTARDCSDQRPIFVTRPGRWRCRNLYMARVALDGRLRPGGRKVKTNHLKAGEWVNIRCQIYAFDKNGNRAGLFDKVGDYYVPDKYMRTRFTGRIPRSPVCARPHPQP